MSERYTLRNPDGSEYGPVGLGVLVEWALQGRIPRGGVLIGEDGLGERSVLEHPAIGTILRSPPTQRGPAPERGDATGGLIPYKNGPALASYYVGIGSWIGLVLFPLGLVAGVIAIALGVKGLRKHKADPAVAGVAHAWVGIICGVLMSLITLGVVVLIVVSVSNA